MRWGRASLCQHAYFPWDYRVKKGSSSCHCSSLQRITATDKVHQCKQELHQAFTASATYPPISTPCQKGTVATLTQEGKLQDSHKNLLMLPEFLVLFFPLVIFVSCKQQTHRRLHATLLRIGHQWDQRRSNLLFPAHSIFYLTYQKERRQTLKNVPQ